MSDVRLLALGQSGFVLDAFGTRLVIDPYLSDSVAETYGESLRRQIPIVRPPGDLTGVDWILLSHAHLDHTDPATLRPLLRASPGARFIAPYESRAIVEGLTAGGNELCVPPTNWLELGPELAVRAIPAAHPELARNAAGELRDVGYLLRCGTKTIYHAGDTSPDPALVEALAGEMVDFALLPINERNYYRDREGIIGNMSVREAFQLAAEIGARTLVPVHWDLFAPNRVYPEEVTALFDRESPPFRLEFLAAGEEKQL